MGKSLYTAGDLAAAMAINPYLKVFSANGSYDAVTPFFQTILNFENMPLSEPRARSNLEIHNYPSGHMIYLDNGSRSAMKTDLAAFYSSGVQPVAASNRRRKLAALAIRRIAGASTAPPTEPAGHRHKQESVVLLPELDATGHLQKRGFDG